MMPERLLLFLSLDNKEIVLKIHLEIKRSDNKFPIEFPFLLFSCKNLDQPTNNNSRLTIRN